MVNKSGGVNVFELEFIFVLLQDQQIPYIHQHLSNLPQTGIFAKFCAKLVRHRQNGAVNMIYKRKPKHKYRNENIRFYVSFFIIAVNLKFCYPTEPFTILYWTSLIELNSIVILGWDFPQQQQPEKKFTHLFSFSLQFPCSIISGNLVSKWHVTISPYHYRHELWTWVISLLFTPKSEAGPWNTDKLQVIRVHVLHLLPLAQFVVAPHVLLPQTLPVLPGVSFQLMQLFGFSQVQLEQPEQVRERERS